MLALPPSPELLGHLDDLTTFQPLELLDQEGWRRRAAPKKVLDRAKLLPIALPAPPIPVEGQDDGDALNEEAELRKLAPEANFWMTAGIAIKPVY